MIRLNINKRHDASCLSPVLCVFQWFLILPIWRKVLRICKKLKIFRLLLRQKSSCHFSAFFTRPGIESILVNYFFLYSTTMWLFSIKSTLCSHFLQFIWIPQEIYLLWHVPTIPFNSQNVIISLSILLLLFDVFFYLHKNLRKKELWIITYFQKQTSIFFKLKKNWIHNTTKMFFSTENHKKSDNGTA